MSNQKIGTLRETLSQSIDLIKEASTSLRYLRPEVFDDADHEAAYDEQIQRLDRFVAVNERVGECENGG